MGSGSSNHDAYLLRHLQTRHQRETLRHVEFLGALVGFVVLRKGHVVVQRAYSKVMRLKRLPLEAISEPGLTQPRYETRQARRASNPCLVSVRRPTADRTYVDNA